MLANIKKTFSPMPAILAEAKQGRQSGYNVFVNGLLAFLVGIGSVLVESAAIIPLYIGGLLLSKFGGIKFSSDHQMLAQLAVTAVPIIVLLIYVRLVEKRSSRTMGFVKEHAVTDYLLGMVIAFAMFSACVGVCVATGAMTFGGYTLNGRFLLLATFFLGFLIQGASEETVCRGFMMTSFGSKGGALAGMLFNSLVFGALHLLNSGVTVLSIANVTLFGVLMSVIVLKLNSIWLACALHSIWNFVQGNFYGVLVSGGNFGTSVFSFKSVEGRELLNGGAFGMEGGLATTCVVTVVIIIFLLIKPREPAKVETPAEASACEKTANQA